METENTHVVDAIGPSTRSVVTMRADQNRKFLNWFAERLGQLNMTRSDFVRQVYGTGERPSHLYPIFAAERTPSRKTLDKWAPVLGVDSGVMEDMLHMRGAKAPPPPPTPILAHVAYVQEQVKTFKKLRRAAVSKPESPTFIGQVTHKEPEPKLLEMKMDGDGKADLTVRLRSVPLELAITVISLLRDAGVLHETPK